MKQSRIVGLDGLRAIAIVGIITYHAYPEFLPGGYLGVMAFFMLMGYLMVYGSSKFSLESPVSSAITYYKKKIKRLYPSLLICISFVLLALAIFVPSYPKSMFSETLSIIFGYNNWWQIAQSASYFDRLLNTSPLTHLWYIGLTIQYYLLWPLFYVLLMKISELVETKHEDYGRYSCYGIIVLLGIISVLILILGFSPDKDPSRLYYGTDSRAFSLFTGMLLGMLPIDRIRRAYNKYHHAFILFAFISLLLIYGACAVAKGDSASNYHFYMPMTNILYAILILCILISQDKVGAFFEKKPFVIVSKYSYEMYLVMYPCLWFLEKIKLVHNAPIAIHVLIVVVTIAFFSFVLYQLSEFLKSLFENESFLPQTLRKVAPVILLIVCLLTCGIQSVVSLAFGGDDKMDKLANELTVSEQQTQEDNSSLVVEMRSTQLAGIASNADGLLTQIESNLNARKAAQAADPNATVTPEEVVATTPIVPPVLNATAIGDSVMLGASQTLMTEIGGIYVDAAKNRRISAANEIITNLKSQGILAETVIIHLGTNGVMTLPDYQSIIDTIGTDHKIYWVNTVGVDWAGEVNANLNSLAESNSNLTIIDWAGYSANHPDWFAADGIHLDLDGKNAYAAYIKECTGL